MSDRRSTRASTWTTPSFIISALVLLIAAVGLRPALGAVVSYYSKLPIELRVPLDQLDVLALESFQRLPDDPNFTKLFSNQDIGTDDWIGIWLRERGGPDLTNLLFVTYYSDPRDTIPHTPEVCYRQGGSVINELRPVTIDTPGLGPDQPTVDALLLDIDSGPNRKVVVYVIVCNGRYFRGRERARLAIGLPGDRYTYFSKIEVVSLCGETDFDAAVDRARRLLGEAIPVLVNDHFPTRDQLRR